MTLPTSASRPSTPPAGVVASRTAAGKHVLVVDAYGALASRPNYKKSLMFNEFHPSDAGYALIAGRWYQALGPFLR
jgi:lysophospholipase L1-like esterase